MGPDVTLGRGKRGVIKSTTSHILATAKTLIKSHSALVKENSIKKIKIVTYLELSILMLYSLLSVTQCEEGCDRGLN